MGYAVKEAKEEREEEKNGKDLVKLEYARGVVAVEICSGIRER